MNETCFSKKLLVSDFSKVMKRRPQLTSPKERNKAQPTLFLKIPIKIGPFENAEQRCKDDVVELKMSKDMQHRLLSFGEEEGR